MAEHVRMRRVCAGMLGTNCYVLSVEGRDDCVVIDPGAEPERIREAMEGRRPAAVLLTHGHFDHIAALDGVMEQTTALVMHEGDAAMLQSPELNASWLIDDAVVCQSRPTRLVTDGDSVCFAGIDLKVLHTPGHTPGGVCYECGRMLFTGDTMFSEGYGRYDLPGGDGRQLMNSLKRLYPMRDSHEIYGGHGS